MSTKSTIIHGDNFHLYHECFENDGVYLELNNAQFEASNNTVTVKIPQEIAMAIQQTKMFTMNYVGMTDEQLKAHALEYIHKRKSDYNNLIAECVAKGETQEEAEKRGGIYKFIGSFHYGSTTDPEDEQLAKALPYLIQERDRQNIVHAKVAEILKEKH